MTNLTLKPIHQDSIIGRMIETKSMADYLKNEIMPYTYQMEDWEKKEYSALYESKMQELQSQKEYIRNNESVFNLILCQYNTSVTIFLYKLFENN